MKVSKILDNVSGTGQSAAYYIDSTFNKDNTGLSIFPVFSSGTIVIEGSANGVDFSPIADCTFTAPEVIPLEPADRTFIRISYSTAVDLTATIVPKVAEGS